MKPLLLAMTALTLSGLASAQEIRANDEYPDFYNGDSTKGIDFVQSIKVLAPRHGSNVKGDVTVVFEAKGMTRVLARCWTQGGAWGRDAVLADLVPDAKGADPGKCGCYVVFRDLAEKNVIVTVTRRGGQGAAAVSGLQLVPAE